LTDLLEFRKMKADRGSSISTLHSTRAEAEAALADYVRRNWAAEMDEE
jgi:hypothetical protein